MTADLEADLATALRCGRQCEHARRANRDAFGLLSRILTSAMDAPSQRSRYLFLRQAKRLVDGVMAEGFVPMDWPAEQEAAYGD